MRLLVYIFVFSYGVYCFSQSDSNLISRHRPGVMWYFNGFRPIKDADNRKYDRLIFDLTYNDWTGEVSPFRNKWNSIGVNTNFMSDIKLKNNYDYSIGIGVGYGYSTISSDIKFIENTENTVLIGAKQPNETYNYSSLHSHRFYMPIELRFSSSDWSRVKFIVGGSFGIQTGLKQLLITKDNSHKQKEINDINCRNKLSYGIHLRFGLRNLAFFGSYQISPMFKKGDNPDIHLVQFGLSLSLF